MWRISVLLLAGVGLNMNVSMAESTAGYTTEGGSSSATARVVITVKVPVRIHLSVLTADTSVSINNTANTPVSAGVTDAVYTVSAP